MPCPDMKSARIQDHFAELTDPRRREVIYPLINVVVIAVCAVICGADDFVAIAKFGRTKREWLARFLDLPNGIPSHDRFNAILAAIKPAEFEKCLLSWITALHEITDGQVIAIDGKTLRRSFDAASSKAAIHMVSAWATANHISLGQVVVDAKSNEITAIPKLLEMLEFRAFGHHRRDGLSDRDRTANRRRRKRTIAWPSRATNRRCIKGSWTSSTITLEDDFARTPMRRYQTEEKGHGRKEIRYYFVCPVPDDLPDRQRWAQLKAIGIAISDTQRDGKDVQRSPLLHSQQVSLGDAVLPRRCADHWGIENRLHWQLDVTFQEDQCRIRKGHADANFSILRRTALSLLKNETTLKVGIKNKRLAAGWDETYLEKVLLGN